MRGKAQNAETFQASAFLPVAHRKILLHTFLLLEPGDGLLLASEAIDEMQIKALAAGEDSPVRNCGEFGIAQRAAFFDERLEPGETVPNKRGECGACLGRC